MWRSYVENYSGLVFFWDTVYIQVERATWARGGHFVHLL